MVISRNNLVAGETLTASVCRASATSVSAIIVGPGKFTLPFTLEGDAWKLSADTAAWPPGLYRWQMWVVSAAGKTMEATGRLTIEPSLESVEAGADNRTTAEKNIEAIEAMLGGKASSSVKRYRINNRELENYSLAELTTLLDYWKRVRRSEQRRNRRIGPNLRVSL